jgi:steroid 5-alpha reductase family enzyme
VIAVLITAALVLPGVLAAAAYALGRTHGRVEAVDELWDAAVAVGAYGQMVRTEAAAEGITVAELLERERRGGSES